jgi:hypothetical protein
MGGDLRQHVERRRVVGLLVQPGAKPVLGIAPAALAYRPGALDQDWVAGRSLDRSDLGLLRFRMPLEPPQCRAEQPERVAVRRVLAQDLAGLLLGRGGIRGKQPTAIVERRFEASKLPEDGPDKSLSSGRRRYRAIPRLSP